MQGRLVAQGRGGPRQFPAPPLGVLVLQCIYVLCLSRVSFGKRAMWVLMLLLFDAMVIAMVVDVVTGSALETPYPYIFAVIPGFGAAACFRRAATDNYHAS